MEEEVHKGGAGELVAFFLELVEGVDDDLHVTHLFAFVGEVADQVDDEGGGFVNEFDVLGKLAAVTLDTQEINAGGDVFDVIEDVVEAVGQGVDVFAVDGGDKGAVGFVV